MCVLTSLGTAIAQPSADEVTAWLGANTEAAQKAYEADLGSYKIGKQVEALQILKRVPPGAEPAVAEEAKAALDCNQGAYRSWRRLRNRCCRGF